MLTQAFRTVHLGTPPAAGSGAPSQDNMRLMVQRGGDKGFVPSRRTSPGGVSLLAVGLLAMSLVMLVPTAANAAFPGSNGVIVFVGSPVPSDRSCGNGHLQDQLFALPAGSSHPVELTCTSGRDQHPFVSPDGSQVVFSNFSDEGVGKLFTLPLSSTGHRSHVSPTLVSDPPNTSDDYPSWSPANDGTIVFQRTISGGMAQLFTESVTNPSSAAPVFASPTGFSDTQPVFDPSNHSLLAFVRTVGDHTHIFTYNVDTQVLTDLSAAGNGGGSGNDSKPDFSPVGPGERIVFESDRACGTLQLYTMTVQGTDQVPVFAKHTSSDQFGSCTPGVDDPVYSPQGDALAFDTNGWGLAQAHHTGGDEGDTLFTVSVNASGAAVGSMHRIGKDSDNGKDGDGEDGITGDQPNWGPQVPPAQTPEAPLPITLPVIGVALAGAAL